MRRSPFAPAALALCGLVCACGSRGSFDAVPLASQRLVATPSGIAVLSRASSAPGLPAEITFGDPNGSSALFLHFAPEWRERGAPLRGYLALEPRAGAAPDADPVTVEVWRVRSSWEPGALHAWSDKPELAPPFTKAVVSSSPASTLRIDVTELLRFAANNPDLDQGLAVIARGGSGHGVSFATGMNGGAAPELEVFTR